MFARTVSTLLIVAIIACPLLCRDGLCQECCSAKQTSQSTCPVHGTASCCSNKTSHECDDQRPCDDAPHTSACQGVCGGAVIEKSNELPVAGDTWFLPFSGAIASVASLLAGRQSPAVDCQFNCSATPGRCIRTLHMSFLC